MKLEFKPKNNMEASARYSVGLLYRREIRAFLDSQKVHGITYIEHKGWLDSDFVVYGSNDWIRYIDQCMSSWIDRLNQAEQ